MDEKQLLYIMPFAAKRIPIFIEVFNAAMVEFNISTPKRQAAFIAQVAHESGEFRYVKELASGKEYDTGRLAERLGNTPDADSDGEKYKGRGLIQITGKSNYAAVSKALYGDMRLLDKPELLENKLDACRSAAWFWKSHGLNEISDIGDFKKITKIINGGLNGYQSRIEYYNRACKILGVTYDTPTV